MKNRIALTGLLSILIGQGAFAQVDWLVFEDIGSASVCDVVNTANNELVILADTGELMIVNGRDTILLDSFVDFDNLVFFEGDPAGTIEFADDADGFRTLWWLTLDGRAVELDPFTAEPFASDMFPTDFFNVPCDACEFVDDPPLGVCDDILIDSPDVFVEICGMGLLSNLTLAMAGFGIVGLRCVRRW